VAVVAPAAATGRLNGRRPGQSLADAVVAGAALYLLQGAGVLVRWLVERAHHDPSGTHGPWQIVGAPWFGSVPWAAGIVLFVLVLAVGLGSARRVSPRYATGVVLAAVLAYPLPWALDFGTQAGDPVTAHLFVLYLSLTFLGNGWIAAALAALAARRAWRRSPAPRRVQQVEPEEDGLG